MGAPTQQDRIPSFATGLALLFPITLSTMAIVLLAPVLPQIMAEFSGVPNVDFLVPIVLTVPALCIALVSPLGGALGDRFGRRRLLIVSLVAYGIVGILPVFLHDLGAILATRIAVGLAEAFIMVTSTTLIGDYFTGRARERWLAAQTAFASVSALLFFNLGGLLGQGGWRTPFWIYASSFVMLGAVLLFTWEPRNDAAPADVRGSQNHRAGWAGFPWRRMLAICAITVFGSVMFYTVQIQAASGLAALGVTNPAQAGFLTSLAALGVPIGTLLYSRLGGIRVGSLLLAEFAAFGVGFLTMSAAQAPTVFLIGCAITQISAGLLLPTLLVWAMRQLSFEMRGRGTGVWQSCFAVGQFASALIVSALSRLHGGLPGAFQWLGYAALAAALVTLVAGLRRGGAPSPQAA